MLIFLRHIRTAWNDYFPSTTTNNLFSQTCTSRQTYSSVSLYVSNCLFKSISSTSTGGALYCNSMTYILVESTSFFSCKTSGQNGGAIYTSGGQCVLCGVCGYDCCTTYTGSGYSYFHFAWISVNSGSSNKNYFNYSSIVRCVDLKSYQTLRLNNGNISCPSVNLSMNKCKIRSIFCDPNSVSNTVTCSFSYSSFTDNSASDYNLFFLWTTGAEFEIKSCNILRNTQGSLNSDGTIYTIGNLMIKDSCILENTANYIFRQGDSNYRITLSSCTVDSTSNGGYFTTLNTITKSFILALNHMSTLNCHSEYDSAGTLTPIIKSPSSSKKPIRLCTCGKIFYQSPLIDFFSLTIILLFNFIHPHPSSNH
jgi:hypothetical protein